LRDMDKIEMILRLTMWRTIERISPDGRILLKPWGMYQVSFERICKELSGESITALVLLGKKPKGIMMFSLSKPPHLIKELISRGLAYEEDDTELLKSLVMEGLNIASGLFSSRLSKVAGEDLLPDATRVLERPEELRKFLCYIGRCGNEFPIFSARIVEENGSYVRVYIILSEELTEKLMAVDNKRILRSYSERPLPRRWAQNER
jgi:chemotaxis protein CheY-P-specific phosphatase CheC